MMLKPIVTYYGTINDIQDREDLMLRVLKNKSLIDQNRG
jgi:hypothetical protein